MTGGWKISLSLLGEKAWIWCHKHGDELAAAEEDRGGSMERGEALVRPKCWGTAAFRGGRREEESARKKETKQTGGKHGARRVWAPSPERLRVSEDEGRKGAVDGTAWSARMVFTRAARWAWQGQKSDCSVQGTNRR